MWLDSEKVCNAIETRCYKKDYGHKKVRRIF